MTTTLQEFPAYKRLPLQLQHAQGNHFESIQGSKVLDLYGGHCVNTLGAGDAQLAEALSSQWSKCSFATNLIDLPERDAWMRMLETGLPSGSWQVFCTNSGAEANENLLKMALNATGKKTVVAFEGAFHGRTAAASAVSQQKNQAWPCTPFPVRRLPWGSVDGIDSSVAAVILEPIQSLAGVVMPPQRFLQDLRSACDESGALLLFDEVQTGNGRLGTMWASQYFDVIPDGFSTAKGCASGFPMGLSFIKSHIGEQVPSGLCGSTFGGGPLAMAAAMEVQNRLQQPGFLQRVQRTGSRLLDATGVGPVLSVRGAGLLLGLKISPQSTAREIRDALLAQGVLTGLCNDPQILRLSPALTLSRKDADHFIHALENLEVRTDGQTPIFQQ
jgi:acetylornithine/succinyldiaminopimelate/putrescine aminotransferase